MITSPYGENSIFIKDIKSLAGAYEDSLQPTNPSTQKAILEGGNQKFKISPKVTGSDVGAANPLQEFSLRFRWNERFRHEAYWKNATEFNSRQIYNRLQRTLTMVRYYQKIPTGAWTSACTTMPHPRIPSNIAILTI